MDFSVSLSVVHVIEIAVASGAAAVAIEALQLRRCSCRLALSCMHNQSEGRVFCSAEKRQKKGKEQREIATAAGQRRELFDGWLGVAKAEKLVLLFQRETGDDRIQCRFVIPQAGVLLFVQTLHTTHTTGYVRAAQSPNRGIARTSKPVRSQ